MIQFRDGPFIRPHPAVWRIVLGINLLYELAMVFLLFQDLDSARGMMVLLDPKLGVPLPEKSYAEDCAFTFRNIWVRTADLERLSAAAHRQAPVRTPSTYSVSRTRSGGTARRSFCGTTGFAGCVSRPRRVALRGADVATDSEHRI